MGYFKIKLNLITPGFECKKKSGLFLTFFSDLNPYICN